MCPDASSQGGTLTTWWGPWEIAAPGFRDSSDHPAQSEVQFMHPTEPLQTSPMRRGAELSLGGMGLSFFGILLAVFAPGRAELSAQELMCPEGVVARVEVVSNSIFSSSDIAGRGNEWAYRVVNRAHYRTRVGFIREHILVSEGQCYDPLLISDSGRLLRTLHPIARVQESGTQLSDGNWLVRFETWDEWSTTLSFNASVEDKFEFKGLRLEENNFLGRGGQVLIKTNEYREKQDFLVKYLTRGFLGSLTEVSAMGGTTRTGYLLEQEFRYPFRGEGGRKAFETLFSYKDRDRSYMTGDVGGISHVLLPTSGQTFDGSSATRFGEPGGQLSLRLDLNLSRTQSDGVPLIALKNEYDDLAPAPDSLVAGLGRQGEPLSYVRVGLTGGLRKLRFETRTGVDLIYGDQDVAIGTEIALSLGRTLATWGTRELSTYAAVELFASQANPWALAQAEFRAEGHLLDQWEPGSTRDRDVMVSGRIVGYLQPPFMENHTLYARVAYTGARNYEDQLQFSLGGSDWIRSLVDFEAPVSQRLAIRVEDRIRIPGLPPALDLGFAPFMDWGRGWGGDLPFSKDIPSTVAVGAGIRLALPARSGSVFRIEWAWPLDGSSGPVFRVVKDRGRTGR